MKQLVIIVSMFLAITGLALDIVKNGKSDYVIIGDKKNPAIQDLQHYIKQMSDVELPIVKPDAKALYSHAIIIGGSTKEKLGLQEYQIKVDGNIVNVFGGDPSGVSHGVYGLLEDQWGCRFLTVKEDFIPKHSILSLPDSLDEKCSPSVRNRLVGASIGSNIANPVWRRRNRVSCDLYGHANHDIYGYLPPKTYFKDNPEWYPLTESGIRKPGCHWLCWSNLDMIKELVEQVKAKMAKTAANKLISLGQGDGFSNPCFCPDCRALVKKYGSEAAPMIQGLNQVLEQTTKQFPDHEIVTFAYFKTGIPPVKDGAKLLPHPSLHFTYVRMGDAMKFIDKKTREQLTAWLNLTNNINIWSWSVGFRNSLCPFPNYKAMAEDTKWYADKVKGVMHQMYGNGEWGALREWLLARIAWNANLDIEDVEKDFLRHYYGEKAAKPLWEILNGYQQLAEKSPYKFNAVFSSKPQNILKKLFPPEKIKHFRSKWQAAIAAAEKEDNPVYVERVMDTMARSFSMLYFAMPKAFKRIDIKGKPWILPGGDAFLAKPVEVLSEILKKTIIWEWAGPELGRRRFLNQAGGEVGPVVENDKIKMAFCLPLDGVLCSFVDKESGEELMSMGPAGKGQLTGMRHTVMTPHAGTEHFYKTEKENGINRIVLSGQVVTNQWRSFNALRNERVFEFDAKRRGFTVNSYLFADSKLPGFALFNIKGYHKKPFRFKLDEKLYDTKLRVSFNVHAPEALSVLMVTPDTTETRSLTAAATLNVPLPIQRKPDGQIKLYITGVSTNKTLELITPWKEWLYVNLTFDSSRKELVFTCQGPKKMAVKDKRVLTGKLEVNLLSAKEAAHVTPVTNLVIDKQDDAPPVLTWQEKAFPGLAGYNVYGAADNQPFKCLTAEPLKVAKWQSKVALSAKRYRFRVTFIDENGAESVPSSFVSYRSGNMDLTEPLLIANNGMGDFLCLTDAVNSLPKTAWEHDITLHVLDTSKEYPAGYGGVIMSENIIKAANKKVLRIIGIEGKPVIHSVIDLNGKAVISQKSPLITVEIRNLRFSKPAKIGIEAPGPGSVIAENEFIEVPYGIKLVNSIPYNGLLIEKNFFYQNKRFAIIDGGAAYGGYKDNPVIIRDNIFVKTTALHFCAPKWVYFINNTLDHSSMRVDPRKTFTIANNIFANKMSFYFHDPKKYKNAFPRITGNVFFRATPVAMYNLKFKDKTLADFEKRFGIEGANRNVTPLWVGNTTPDTKKPGAFIPVTETCNKPGARPDFYKLRKTSPCITGGNTDLPQAKTDFFGTPRTPGKFEIGATVIKQ
jgi:hypothetical protein